VVVALLYGRPTPRRPAGRAAATLAAATLPPAARADAPPPLAPREPASPAVSAAAPAAGPARADAPTPPPALATATTARPRPPARSRPAAPAKTAAPPAPEDGGPVKVGSFSMVDLGGPTAEPSAQESIPAPAAQPVAQPAGGDDAPQFATAGFRKPQLAQPGCVQRNVRLPRGAAPPASVTLKFAVASDGTVGLFEVLGATPDRRVTDALWTAVRGCGFVPGADAQGRPTRLWVLLPIRFD
jgi:hypothetical protein